VIKLQVEVSGDESWKFVVVVLLINMEQLLMLGRYDGKAVATQVIPQSLIWILQQGRIHDIGDVHLVILVVRLEIQLAELFLALYDTIYESSLFIGESDDFWFDAVIVFFAI
jgi:hypothetical protein